VTRLAPVSTNASIAEARSDKEDVSAVARPYSDAKSFAGFVTSPCVERQDSAPQGIGQAAATAVRHVSMAAARSAR
jgi:hypothetical protein